MVRRLSPPALVAAASTLLVGCAALLDFEAGTEEGSGGAGATTATTTSGPGTTASVASSGAGGGGAGGAGACEGCLEGGACLAGDEPDACGRGGDACVACDTDECVVATCEEGACALEDLPIGTECTGGRCRNGVCEPNEDCTDGFDDDDDGFIDCEDDDCATFAVCLPPVPAGWAGPYAVYQGPEGVTCPESWPIPLGVPLATTLAVGAVTCPTCSCDTSCSATYLEGPAKDCTTWTLGGTIASGSCAPIAASDLSPQQVFGYSPTTACLPRTTGTTTYEANRYDDVLTVCGSGPSSSCQLGTGLCKSLVPDDPLAEERICVALHAAAACPADWSDPIAADGGTPVEGRYCTGCSCGLPSADCGGALRVYGDAACTICGNRDQVCEPVINACVTMEAGAYFVGYDAVNDPVCPPVPSTVQGQVTPGDPWTLCCQQLPPRE